MMQSFTTMQPLSKILPKKTKTNNFKITKTVNNKIKIKKTQLIQSLNITLKQSNKKTILMSMIPKIDPHFNKIKYIEKPPSVKYLHLSKAQILPTIDQISNYFNFLFSLDYYNFIFQKKVENFIFNF